MSTTTPKARRPARRPAPRAGGTPPLARPRPDLKPDTSRQDAFLKLPMEERERRIQAFIDYFAPAFADYSSQDFIADRRREAERDN